MGDCRKMLKSFHKRLIHIGADHGVFQIYKEEGFVEAIDNPLQLNYRPDPNNTSCEYCWEEFTLEAFDSHFCCKNNNEEDPDPEEILPHYCKNAFKVAF